MPRWCSAAAVASPPMPAPMMAMERTGSPTAEALLQRDIGGPDHAAPVRNFPLDVGAELLGRTDDELDLGGRGLEPLAQRARLHRLVHVPGQPVHGLFRGAGGRQEAEPDRRLVAGHA